MDITNMNLLDAGFVALVTIGFVNVLTFFKPDMDSRVKFAASMVCAFGLTFVPIEMGNMILEKLKVALGVSLGTSGLYKVAQKLGGK